MLTETAGVASGTDSLLESLVIKITIKRVAAAGKGMARPRAKHLQLRFQVIKGGSLDQKSVIPVVQCCDAGDDDVMGESLTHRPSPGPSSRDPASTPDTCSHRLVPSLSFANTDSDRLSPDLRAAVSWLSCFQCTASPCQLTFFQPLTLSSSLIT